MAPIYEIRLFNEEKNGTTMRKTDTLILKEDIANLIWSLDELQ